MILSLAGCGSEQATPPADQPSATTSVQPSAGEGQNSLTVQVKASPQAPATTWKLNCDPAGGDHPKAAQACAALTKVGDPFKPPPADQMCTKIYGGPQVATVKGTWQAKPVDAKFTRTDGCEMSRWSKVAPLFGDLPKS
ncbi:SSI family serine proteinase inhibitor [Actinomadura viridis]|uniref:SSI family serine proteinase inhibitor n=1 Tax=Actinomadura viridis TaxID=58110 RepID=UPI0036B73304